MSGAFNPPGDTVLTSTARTLEDLVKDMLRPMLKAWLDDNLPPLVERLVRAEIERVARRRASLAKLDPVAGKCGPQVRSMPSGSSRLYAPR